MQKVSPCEFSQSIQTVDRGTELESATFSGPLLTGTPSGRQRGKYQCYCQLQTISGDGKIKHCAHEGFQAAGAAPWSRESLSIPKRCHGHQDREPCERAPCQGSAKGNGRLVQLVTDEEILSAQYYLSSKAASSRNPHRAAARLYPQLKRQGRLPKGKKIVMVLTGNGLKDPDTAMSQVGGP
jgi:hypothetical protein